MEYEDISSLLVKAVTNFSSRQHHLISFMDVLIHSKFKKLCFLKREQITQCSLHRSYNTEAYLAIHL